MNDKINPDLAAARERARDLAHGKDRRWCAACRDGEECVFVMRTTQVILEVQRDEAQRGVTRLTRYRVAELNAAIEEAKRS